MLIDLTKSQLFTVDPDTRFANEYRVPKGTWTELWRRHKLMDYTVSDLKDYLFIKYARNPSYNSIRRWVYRTEIYSMSTPMMKKGVVHVSSSFFGDHEQWVIDELTKQMRYGASNDSRIII